MDKEEKEYWRVQRLTRKITLSEIGREIGCKHNHLSQMENKLNYYIKEEKMEAYKEYIRTHDNRDISMKI